MNTTTDELLKILKNKNVDTYLEENKDELVNQPLKDYLNKLLAEKNLTIPEVVKNSNMAQVYTNQIFSGVKKNPSRDKLIQLCFGMNADFDETQTILKYSGYAPLYPRDKRDSIIISAFMNNLPLMKCNEMLDENNLSPLA